MSKQQFELSRRKALAGIGGIGVASAGAGLGTSAYFTDTESFDNNTVTAGELDLVLDWQEQYSAAADTKGFDNVRFVDPETTSASDLGDHEMGIPTQQNPSVVVDTSNTDGSNEVTVAEYMAATAIDSFPDTSGRNVGDVDGDGDDEEGTGTADDGVQDDIPINDGEGSESAECQYLQPLVPDDGGVLSSAARTQATDLGHGPNPQTTQSGDSLVSITDVKPGDFGEVTFSLHLCGNPGYISITGGLDDQNSDQDLLDAARGVIWYDAGDNGLFDDENAEDTEGDNILQNQDEEIIGEEGNRVFQGTLSTVLGLLKEDPGIPLDGDLSTSFNEVVAEGSVGSTDAAVIPDASGFDNEYVGLEELPNVDSITGTIGCDVVNAALGTSYGTVIKIDDIGEDDFDNIQNTIDTAGEFVYDNSLTEDVTVTISDYRTNEEGEITELKISTDSPINAAIPKGGSSSGGGNSGDGFVVYEDGTGVQLDGVWFGAPNNKGLSFFEICANVTIPEESTPGREPFPNSTTAFIGFAWWLPPSVGNEVQGQSLEFDIGFMAEQARHNDDPSV